MKPKIIFFDCDGVLINSNTWENLVKLVKFPRKKNDLLWNQYYSGKLLIFSFIDELTGLPKLLINEFVSKNKNFTLVNNLFDYWGNQSYQLYDKHPNTLGHQKIAEGLFKYILDHFLINCRELQSR